ncbi:hypothetical protein [Methylobacterium sp. Leaf93]|uniref:hypothetical protein n=1 Tax=Methylobacterium sp. Leaf93 TaxID=1736249 RepID=UPI0012E7C761|nr:hypothetical protein [Methylobacterium sp. Leaf93]
MMSRFGLSLGVVVLTLFGAHGPALSQGVLDEIREWDRTAPTRDAKRESPEHRTLAARALCSGEQAPCESQLLKKGWRIVSSGVEPLGVDMTFEFKLLKFKNVHSICTAFVSYDGSTHERPCQEMAAHLNSVKD